MRSFLFATIFFAILALLSSPVAASPAPSAIARRSTPSARHEARAPLPSGVARRSVTEQEPVVSADDVAEHLCPSSMSVCPIAYGSSLASTPTSLAQWLEDGFECVDFSADLVSCGGCGSLDTKFDCTAIPGSLGVSCIAGSCRVESCRAGYSLSPDGSSCLWPQRH